MPRHYLSVFLYFVLPFIYLLRHINKLGLHHQRGSFQSKEMEFQQSRLFKDSQLKEDRLK